MLRQKFLEHVAQTSPAPLGVEIERAGGVFLYTPPTAEHPEGRPIFDLISGVSVSNVGHGNGAVVSAVQDQAARYMHAMVYGELIETPQVTYAARLASLLPESLQSVYFVNSGAEAVEGALKLAKRAAFEREGRPESGDSGQNGAVGGPLRRELVAFRRAYHGSTSGALSLMSSPEGDEWRRPFEPLLSDVKWLTFNDFDGLDAITERTACVVVEPVQGEAGVRLPASETLSGETAPINFLQALRARCDRTGALLVFDEIQTGMGRTGRGAAGGSGLFAFQKYGVVPDILCLAKAFGGGMPLGAFIASKELMSLLSHDPALGHITTFGGHPVCCAAGLAALEVLLDGDLLSQVEAKGALFEELLKGHPAVKEIRRSGLLMAVEVDVFAEFSTKTRGARPDGGAGAAPERPDEVSEHETPIAALMQKFLARGVLSDWFLFCDTAFRISPPLVISEAEIRESCRRISECLDEFA